jgi:hypothetical protein
MTGRRILLAAAVVAAVVLAVWLMRGCGAPPTSEHEPEATTQAIRTDDIAVVSRDLAVRLVEMRATLHPDYTDWSCVLECREGDGCRADIRMIVDYHSSGEKEKIFLSGRLDAGKGETMRVGRVQRPATEVESIDRAMITVTARHDSNQPRPTEIE